MQIKFYTFLVQCLIICIQYDFVISKAFIGQNVRRANDGEFTFVVAIKQINYGNLISEQDYVCSGSLISAKDVVTVSHVFERAILHNFEIIIGSVDLRSNTKRHPAWWINYVQWCTSLDVSIIYALEDIAMIRLTEAIPEEIIPVILLPVKSDTLYGHNITVAGWGMTRTGGINRYLKTAVLKVMTNTQCDSRIAVITTEENPMPDNVLCSSTDPYVLSSAGDSGGPVLFMGLFVAIHIGIIPNVGPDPDPRKVNLHLSITDFIEFIAIMLELD